MNYLLRASRMSISAAAVAAIASGVFACSSSTNGGQGTSTTDGGGGAEGGVVGTEAGGGGDGGTGGDGSGGGDGGGATTRGSVSLAQSRIGASVSYNYGATFHAFGAVTGTGTIAPTTTTVGDCTATVIPRDPNAVLPTPVSGLNAGAITLAGSGTPASATLVYGPKGGMGLSDYPDMEGTTAIFAGGDTFTLSGTGGNDLPSFAAQTIVTPSDIVVTAPVCGGSCPDLNRTVDLPVTWTGGGAGKVVVAFETIAPTQVVLVQCKFSASAGSGTVPASILGVLDKAGDPGISGIELINPVNTVDFVVGTTPTTFTVQSTAVESTLTVSN